MTTPVSKHKFEVTYSGDRPTPSGPANRAELRITEPSGDVTILRLNSSELRSLQRAALQGLGYTKVARDSGQWDSTWSEDIKQKIDPILVVTKAIFPLDAPKKVKAS